MATSAPRPEPERGDALGPEEARIGARERALGRHADRPGEIPLRGWKSVLKRVWNEAIGDQIPMVAASCGFYALLALFPAISVLISLYGLAFDPIAVKGQLEAVRDVLPATTYELIANRVHDLVTAEPAKLSWGLAISFLVALWSATAGTKAMLTALNVAYEEKEKRSFLVFNLVAILFTLGGLLGTTLALAIIVGVPAVLNLTWLGPGASLAIRLISFVLLLAFAMLALAVLYRFGPSRHEARWRWVTPGSALAAVLWLAASLLFSFYAGNFAAYDAYYGSLGAVVVALMWFWLSAFAVLMGAELNAELELQTRKDTTTGLTKPMGERGAFVADHVAAH